MFILVVAALGTDNAPIAYQLDTSQSIHKEMDKEKPGINQGGRGHWTVDYTGTQSFINTVSQVG